MAAKRDRQQYTNEKGVSLNHLLIKMINQILTADDKNSAKEKMAVILTIVDYSKAFKLQSHIKGVESFIQNGVRPSLIPVLISFFKSRSIIVNWKGILSKAVEVSGGRAQGGTVGGILEYVSQTNGNMSFFLEEEAWKFMDDASMIEILNLAMIGLSSYNIKSHIPSDIATDEYYLDSANSKTQDYINRISNWSDRMGMRVNPSKTKFMVFNFCLSSKFKTRLIMNGELLEQGSSCRLLGVEISDTLKWQENTNKLIKKPYQRMSISRNLSSFSLPSKDLYKLYIRSLLEQSSVIWSKSLTEKEIAAFE